MAFLQVQDRWKWPLAFPWGRGRRSRGVSFQRVHSRIVWRAWWSSLAANVERGWVQATTWTTNDAWFITSLGSAHATPKTQTNQRIFENRKRKRARQNLAEYLQPSGSIVTGVPVGTNLTARYILEEDHWPQRIDYRFVTWCNICYLSWRVNKMFYLISRQKIYSFHTRGDDNPQFISF